MSHRRSSAFPDRSRNAMVVPNMAWLTRSRIFKCAVSISPIAIDIYKPPQPKPVPPGACASGDERPVDPGPLLTDS